MTVVTKTSPREERRDGSSVEIWTAEDPTYWAVLDLNVRNLRSFVDLARGQGAQNSSFFLGDWE